MFSTNPDFSPATSRRTAKNLAVLVVDDDEMNVAVVRAYLADAGHRVVCARGAHEAYRLLENHPIDLIFTEVIMPEGDGLELIMHAKKNFPGIATVAMSAGGRYLPAADCLHVAHGIGARACLLKPLSRDLLLATIDHVMGVPDLAAAQSV